MIRKQASGLRTYDGAVAVVTGGASGIGWALAQALAARGAFVVIADLQEDLAASRGAAVAEQGGEAWARAVDVKDPDALRLLVGEVREAKGRLDYFFNNAGVGVGGSVLRQGLEDWNHQLDVNLRGVVHGVLAAYPCFLEQGFGHLVNTASMAGLIPTPMATSYCASKHAVVGLSLSLRLEAAEHGVRVTALCPGVIRTPILTGGRYGRRLFDASEEEQSALWKLTRPMDPDRFARRVLRRLPGNPAILIVPAWWRLLWLFHRLAPGLHLWLGTLTHPRIRRRLEAGASPTVPQGRRKTER